MIDYDSFSRCHLTDIFFRFSRGSKRVKAAVQIIGFCPDRCHFSPVLFDFCSHAVLFENLHSLVYFMALYRKCCFSNGRFVCNVRTKSTYVFEDKNKKLFLLTKPLFTQHGIQYNAISIFKRMRFSV